MPKVIEKLEAELYLQPEGGGIFCLADDGLIYKINGPERAYWLMQLQPIREGLTFLETLTWEQFVFTGCSNPEGPRGGGKTFRSMKKALESLEKDELQWVPDVYYETDADRQKAYLERISEDYLPSLVRWALSKGKGEDWACSKAGIRSFMQPWKTKPCPVVPLQSRT